MRRITGLHSPRRLGSLDHSGKSRFDVLAQQIVAATSSEDWTKRIVGADSFAWPYRNLARAEFEEVVKMLAEGLVPSVAVVPP